VCRGDAGSEPAAVVTGIAHYSKSGVQSCHGPHYIYPGGESVYQALYRKWRPQTFDEVVGQRHITETLKNQVKSGRFSHAYIFIGTRGTGKTTCARILAKAVNCENPVNGNPCCKCPACLGIADGSFMDIVELDAASNNGVDNVRALREEAVFSPANLKKRVYIIDEVHMLSQAAFNALLKILEEPPKHLMFILATTELHKVPATILSRCQRHSFRRIDSASIAEYISYVADSERIGIEADAAELIARLAEGGVRDALSLLDQCSGKGRIDLETVYSSMGLAGKRRVAKMLENIIKRDSEAAVTEFTELWMDGKDPASFLEELSGLLRDVLMLKVAPRSSAELVSGSYDSKTLKSFARSMTVEELSCAMQKLQKSMAEIKEVKNTKTAAELCLISLCHNVGDESIAELKARISRLEETIEKGVSIVRAGFNDFDEEEYEFVSENSCNEEEYISVRQQPEYEEDELIADAFTEEQPEDAFLQRSRGDAEAEPTQEQSAADNSALWEDIKEILRKKLPMPLPLDLKSDKINGRIDQEQLFIEVQEGFMCERFKRPMVIDIVREAVKEVLGRELRIQVIPFNGTRAQRDIEELKKFKEVRFI